MPMLKNRRKDLLAEHLANGEKQYEAYVKAGYEGSKLTARKAISRMLHEPKFKERLEELRDRKGRKFANIRELAKDSSVKALKVLVEIATGEGNPASARVSAANAILERAWGKAPQPHTGDSESPIEVIKHVIVDITGNIKHVGEGKKPLELKGEVIDVEAETPINGVDPIPESDGQNP